MARYASMVVDGNSMQPTYNAGDWLMGRWANYTLHGLNRLSVGDIVVIERDEQPGIFYLKRISEAQKSDDQKPRIFLLSDNPTGTDSRHWGWISVTNVRAKIFFRIKRAKS